MSAGAGHGPPAEAGPVPPAGPGADREVERLARVALNLLTEPGDPRVTGLVAQLGPVALHEALLAETAAPQLREEVSARLRHADAAGELERAERLGIRFVMPGDPQWPAQVDALDGAEPLGRVGGRPLGLWVRGPAPLDARAVAVVGSRSSTTYGDDAARGIAAALARAGRPVVSGAAFGIDVAAHRGALAAGGSTIAVLACGVDRVYPAEHRSLLEHLRHEGAVVSEAAPGRAPMRMRFLSRNRVIAALAAGTVVAEAAIRSGSLNTANWAGRLNRLVMGVPGPVTSAASQGVHELIRSGAGTLVASGEQVLELVGSAGVHLLDPARAVDRPRDRLDRRHQRVLEAVPLARWAASDAIARAAGMPLLATGSTLASLELLGFVRRGEDGWRLAAHALR